MNHQHLPDHEHAVDLEGGLDFLNTIELESGQPVDHLVEPGDAAAWFAAHGLVHLDAAAGWTAADLDRARGVRDALRDVVDAVVEGGRADPGSVELVNDALATHPTARLELDGAAVRIGHRHSAAAVDDALAGIADVIVAELANGRPERFRICANDRCRWTFYDDSPTGRRRWCDMKTCGNRAKAARHRERVRATAIEAPLPATPEGRG